LGVLQEIAKEEVAKHKTKETGIWVTYKDGVYDVTDFVEMHPGGAGRLMLAAGGAIDPFWAMYAQHNTEEVHSILQEYYIGKLVRRLALYPFFKCLR
jgi:sulfite oxidase